MNMGFGPPVPEPFGGDFLDMAENEMDQPDPGPPSKMLESIENSIVQPSPPVGLSDVPPDTMLDLVERSTERQVIPGTQLPEHLQDHRLWNLMDALELATENQVIKKEKPVEAPAPVPGEVYGSFPQAVAPHLEAGFIREHPYPDYRMTGGRTGIRSSGGGMTYCRLRDIWISQDECDGCNAFELADDASGDDERCRYAF